MNIFSIVEPIIQRLSSLPGLGFLHNYVMDFHSRKEQIRGQVQRYQGYVSTVRGAGADVAQAARGSKQEEADDEEDAVEDDIDEEESFMQ